MARSPGLGVRRREDMKNVEYKAELRDIALARSICAALGARFVQTMEQTDTYFRTAAGRLKRRETVGEETEWIRYERPDVAAARVSAFTIYTHDEALERFGAAELPVWVVVKKRRELWLWENVRIHLDEVDGLGRFIELEALVRPGITEEECGRRVAELRQKLGPAMGEGVAVGYSDLIAGE